MNSLKELLIIGPGPSSSHTIGPYRICLDFLRKAEIKDIDHIIVTLYDSLALTGKGHGTDKIIIDTFKNFDVQIIFDFKTDDIPHPNTMRIQAFYKSGKNFTKVYCSTGGGAFQIVGENTDNIETYPFNTFDDMKKILPSFNNDIYALIEYYEGKDIFLYARNLLLKSFDTIRKSLKTEGILPGPLRLKRVSKDIFRRANDMKIGEEKRELLLTSYSYATSEANAASEMIVTTPTCGASGVVPAILYYIYKDLNGDLNKLVRSYLVGALVANFIKQNASISGAVLGCQAEIGSAASFAAASLAYYNDLTLYQIEYAAEVSMEHFLGLTCDPVDGYVQIPCIERNAIASIHAYAAYLLSKNVAIYRHNRVSFDKVILAMNDTGKQLPSDLKETSKGGLAKVIC